MFANVLAAVEQVPEFRPLILRIPLSEFVAMRKEPLFGPSFLASCAESVGELNASALHVIEVPMQFATGGVERVLLLLGMAAVEQWSSILSRITEQSLR